METSDSISAWNPENYYYQAEGAQCSLRMLAVSDQVTLRVFCYIPAVPSGNIPIVFVVGLSSFIETFKHMIGDLTRDFPFFLIENRDCESSVIRGKVKFDIESIGQDLAAVIRILGLEEGKYALMGYSFGTAAVADAFRALPTRPRCIVFMEPTPVFHYPGWSLFLIRWFGLPFFKALRAIAKWYLGHFVINKKEDNEMALDSSRALDHAVAWKMRSTILEIARYSGWDKLPLINCPTLIVAATRDKFHIHEEIKRMESLLPDCSYVDLETNLRTHSAEMGQVVRSFILKFA